MKSAAANLTHTDQGKTPAHAKPRKKPTATSEATSITMTESASTSHMLGKQATAESVPESPITTEALQQMIATAAYYRAIERGFAAGHDHEDWYTAEREITLMLST